MNAIIREDLNTISYQLVNNIEELRDCNLFISGGTGFIGKWLVHSLLYLNDSYNLNLKVEVLSRNPKKFIDSYPDFSQNDALSFIQGDVRDFEFNSVSYSSYQYVIHAATEADAYLNVDNPMLMSDVIVNGTKHMLDFAAATNAHKFLFLSSGAVYGEQPFTIDSLDEEYLGAPLTIEQGGAYAHSKRLAEFFCSHYSRKYGFYSIIARCFAFIGPYLPLEAHYAIGNFINNGLMHKNITIKSDGKPLRTYMYATDMVVMLIKLLTICNETSIFNVGSKNVVSIKEVADLVAGYFSNVEVEVLNQKRIIDRNYNYIPNVKKVEELLGPTSMVSLNDSIGRTIKFYEGRIYE